MAGVSFRDRLLTPAGARAITSPSAILLAGVGAAAGIVALGPVGAVLGVGAYLARVATSLPKAPSREEVTFRGLAEPWAGFVREALVAQRRFERAVSTADAGAIRERLTDIGARIDDGVRECNRIARRGQELDAALAQLEPVPQLQRRLMASESEATRGGGSASAEQVAQSLRGQIASTSRIAGVAMDARERLAVLDARLDESVARAVELSLRTGDLGTDGLRALGGDVDALVADMEALRQALDETSAAARATP